MIPRYVTGFDTEGMHQKTVDFLVIGSGIAGLFAALHLAGEGRVLLLTKEEVRDCNTEYAQGGIAAVVDDNDTVEAHFEDTVEAGAGLCNPHAVKILVSQGYRCIQQLIDLGVDFDRSGEEIALTREGAHSCRRILHARGDATGAEIRESLMSRVEESPNIEVCAQTFVSDLLTRNGRCLGVMAHDRCRGERLVYRSPAVILATGGAGQLYHETSNPRVATGDGVAMAYRAGADVMDMEFIQFHPTTLRLDGNTNFLISEAMRGEGGVLRNHEGERFMDRYHELRELAPRDIVTRAIYSELKRSGQHHVYLDMTAMAPEFIKARFPTIYRTCRREGVDITTEYIPVFPAAHYMMGGVLTNTCGETSIPGLFACGEVACLGLHGANRLASNSLLEGLVFSERLAGRVAEYRKKLEADTAPGEKRRIRSDRDVESAGDPRVSGFRARIRDIMTEHVAVIRSETSLREGLEKLKDLDCYLEMEPDEVDGIETLNMMITAGLIARAALIREESRGAHYRSDYEQPSVEWLRHIVMQRDTSWRSKGIEFE